MKPIHQVLPAAAPGDAVTNQALAWRDLLQQWGRSGSLVAEHVHPELRGEVTPLHGDGLRLLKEGDLILRYSVWSKAVDAALAAPGRVALCYHNVTPGEYLRDFNPALADLCDRGRRALPQLRNRLTAMIADSSFNAADLREAGLGDATVVPLLLDLPPEPEQRDGRRGEPVVLSVGRIVPNKRLEDVVKAFALYQRHRAPGASLVLVGSDTGFERYRGALELLIERIGVKRVSFTGPLSTEARDSWYRRADVYLSLSVHEGFCAPLVEAIAHGVPVVARAAGAVPETLDGAGLLLDGLDLALVSEALHELASSSDTRAAFQTAAARRLAELRPEAVAPRIRSALAPLLETE